MIPILSDTIVLSGQGIGGLQDCIECKVNHEINGDYSLMMRYPVTGAHFGDIKNNYIIYADPGWNEDAQPFRIYRITKPLNGIVTIYANHLCYDMSGIVVRPFSAQDIAGAVTGATANQFIPTIGEVLFRLATDRTAAVPYVLSAPRSMWKVMGGQEGSLLDVYGGEWDLNGYTATLRNRIGADNGVKIQYGQNLTELEQDTTLESTYKGVYPFWYDEETGTLVTLPEEYIRVSAAPSTRILCLDAGEHFQEQPTVEQLRNYATSYITNNGIGSPKTSWKIDFVMLAQSAEYADTPVPEAVSLGDTVHVIYKDMDVDISARVVQTEYDVLLDRYNTLTLGRVKQNLAAIVTTQNKEIEALKKSLERTIVAQRLKGTESVQAGADDTARAVMNGSGITFTNAGGSVTGSYPATGIPETTAGILFGQVDDTSTSTVFTATIPGVTSYYDGLAIMLKNGVANSAAGFTLDINGLGPKHCFNNLTVGTQDTTIFNSSYTMLFIYDSHRGTDGGWICFRGYDSNTNTIGYQLRTQVSTMPMKSITYRYRLLFTSADGKGFVPANNSSSTNATASRTVCQTPIDPHGLIYYYGTTASVEAGAMPSAAYMWQQYSIALGYSFNRTGSALTLTDHAPVYLKCTPQSNGSAIMDANTPIVQALPSSADGKIYILLGIATSETAMELNLNHPVYHYTDGAIRRWIGP